MGRGGQVDLVLRVILLLLLVILPTSIIALETVVKELTICDGKIAFVSDRDGNNEIYVMDTDGRNVQRLTFSDDGNSFPDWSPDGTQIVFEVNPLSLEPSYISIMNADGSELHRLVDDGQYPTWSPDGDKIAFTLWLSNGSADIYTINVDGSNLTKVFDGQGETYGLFPTWSPDSDKLLFVFMKEIRQYDNYFELTTIDLVTGEKQLLYAVGTESYPDWSGMHTKNELVLSLHNLAGTTIVRLNADGSSITAREVTSNPDPLNGPVRYDEYPSWSPGGTKIVFSSSVSVSKQGYDDDIYIADADGEQWINLTLNTDSDDKMPDWGPSSNQGCLNK